jgi:hypothetical protein
MIDTNRIRGISEFFSQIDHDSSVPLLRSDEESERHDGALIVGLISHVMATNSDDNMLGVDLKLSVLHYAFTIRSVCGRKLEVD